MPTADVRFPTRMRALMEQRGLTYRHLADVTHYSRSYLHDIASGKKAPGIDVARRLDTALGSGGELAALLGGPTPEDDELDALELARRVEASDVSSETLIRLETVVDDLAVAYATAAPPVLLPRVRRHLRYVTRLVDARATLAQRRRLLVVGGWLSLLAATLHIDLGQTGPAAARLSAARGLAEHAGHAELAAWCRETRAWEALTAGDLQRALLLSQEAQGLAPARSSALIQATAQEGRAWARMGRPVETRAALNRVARLVSPLPQPQRPEHHYRYDPGKAVSYTATTLAWVGDPAAEEFARETVRHLEVRAEGPPRPRRVAMARLDLGLALLTVGKLDEAGACALASIGEGWVAPAQRWQAAEVVAGVRRAGLPEAAELAQALDSCRRPPTAD